MFKYIGLSKRSHPLDHKRYRAIADKQRRLRAVDLAMLETADRATQRRLSVAQDAETAARLTQRCHDLAQIRTYFQTQTEVTFLGMYGWGAGCQVSAAPGQGISEYDAIVYEKNGRIVVEKIGSCWQLFRQQERFSGKGSSDVITSGGDVFWMNALVQQPSEPSFREWDKTSVSTFFHLETPFDSSTSRTDAAVENPMLATIQLEKESIPMVLQCAPCTVLPKKKRTAVVSTGVESLSSDSTLPEIQDVGDPNTSLNRRKKKQIPAGLTFMQRPRCTDKNCTDKGCSPNAAGVDETIRVRSNSPLLELRSDRETLGEVVLQERPLVKRPESQKRAASRCEEDIFESVSSEKDKRLRTDPLVLDAEEGCPCCLNAIDLDELAGLGKILNNTGDAASHVSFELATVDASWGLVAGLAGPFAMIGLVAAYRNVVGAYATRQVLRDKLAEVERLIAEASTPQLLAYRYCLQYSLFDTHWNIAVPGVLNGGSSTAVLSTLIVSSPLAIPALGAYATAQAGRGIYDMARFWNTMTGHDKIDQITRSKRLFYMSNTTAFTCMGVGAALVAVSPVTLGATLIPGLCLLIAGTVSSGVLNNIWPRKFRPRNGDLGVRRDTLNSQKCETLISKMREQKTIIKTFKKKHMHNSGALRVRKVLAKLTAVLPFCEKRAGNWLHALGQEQIAASMTQMTMHQSELFENLGIAIDAGVKVEDVVINGLKQLRYQQYGLVDFYWGLKRFEG